MPGKIHVKIRCRTSYHNPGSNFLPATVLFHVCMDSPIRAHVKGEQTENKPGHYGYVTWASCRLKSSATQSFIKSLFQPDNKGVIKATTGDRWFPSQRANNADNTSMSWRHDACRSQSYLGGPCGVRSLSNEGTSHLLVTVAGRDMKCSLAVLKNTTRFSYMPSAIEALKIIKHVLIV